MGPTLPNTIIMDFLKNILRGDTQVWGLFFITLLASGIVMYSASSTLAYRASEYYVPISGHISYLVFGAVVTVVFHNMPLRLIRGLTLLGYVPCVLLLMAVMATAQVNGASRFIFGIQPSEPARLMTVGVLAYMLTHFRRADGTYDSVHFWWMMGLCAAPVLLITVENFSTGLLLAAVCFCMLFIGKLEWKRMRWLIAGGVAVIVLFFGGLKVLPYEMLPGRAKTWKARIERSSEDLVTAKITDENRQAQYGHMAIANGGLMGRFAGRGQIRDFLPQGFSDFVYSIIFEEWGLWGGGLTMLIYLFLIWRVYNIYIRCKTEFPKLLLVGVSLLIVFQALMNMAVGVGLFLTGQPLPLISRGGSSIMVTCAYFGIILAISRLDRPDEGPEWQTSRSVEERMRQERDEQEAMEAQALADNE